MPVRSISPRWAHAAAALLLACYFAQCCWLIRQLPMEPDEGYRAFLQQYSPALDSMRSSRPVWQFPRYRWIPDELPKYESPLVSQIARAVPWKSLGSINPKVPIRLPFALIGVLLGLSLWFIAQKWYGATGGLFGLALYCFSPPLVVSGALVWPELLATWGFYGAVFLAIATAHSLYAAPRSLGWWRQWRTPLLFGMALGIGTAAQFWCVLAIPVAFGYALYLAPERRRDAALRLLIGCLLAFVVLLTVYRWHINQAFHALRYGTYLRLSAPSFELNGSVDPWLVAFAAAIGIALGAWLRMRTIRHFSNSAALLPCLIAIFLVPPGFGIVEPLRKWPLLITFVSVFAGGVFNDLVQSRYGGLWRIAAVILAAAAAIFGFRATANF